MYNIIFFRIQSFVKSLHFTHQIINQYKAIFLFRKIVFLYKKVENYVKLRTKNQMNALFGPIIKYSYHQFQP